MDILEICESDSRNLRNIANTLATAKKIVVITGAGISTNCGIPDFRSQEGLYSLIQAQYNNLSTSKFSDDTPTRRCHHGLPDREITPVAHSSLPTNVKGRDLFDSQLWSNPKSTSIFYRFISSLRRKIRQDVKNTTPTHRFIRTLRDRRKLVRCYTQNIDGLESREGLSTDLRLGKGNRKRFAKKFLNRPLSSTHSQSGGPLDLGCEVVQLHGELENLRCTLCQQTCSWDIQLSKDKMMLLTGTAPQCILCLATDQDRRDRGKRGTRIGYLRPNVVLYGEEHPAADILGSITTHDLSISPDVLLVLGTSLRVHGLKTMVREFAKAVHGRRGERGTVIFVNLSRPSTSVWKDVFDYWVSMDCDAWVGAMKTHRPDLFQVQDELKMPIRKTMNKPASRKSLGQVAEIEKRKENIGMDPNISVLLDKFNGPKVVVPRISRKRRPLQNREDEVHLTAPSSFSPKKRTRMMTGESEDARDQMRLKRRKASTSVWSDAGGGG